MSCPQCGHELEDFNNQEGGWCPICKEWWPSDIVHDMEEEEEDELCGEWMSFGSEECEFCLHADSCRELTLEAMKRA